MPAQAMEESQHDAALQCLQQNPLTNTSEFVSLRLEEVLEHVFHGEKEQFHPENQTVC